jgi:hypothetical protein
MTTANLARLDHLSVSSIRGYLECPKCWAAKRFDGAKGPPGVALIKGKAVDVLATENWRQKAVNLTDMPMAHALEVVEDVYRSEVDRAGGRSGVDWRDESFTRALDSTLRLARGHMADHAGLCTPAGVQVKFSRRLADGRAVIGFLDAVDQNGDVIDVKTGSRRMPQHEADRDMQASAYAFGLARPIKFRWFRVLDLARTTTEIVESDRGQNAVDWFADVASSVSVLIDAGVYPAHPGYWCGWCPIAASCVASLTS